MKGGQPKMVLDWMRKIHQLEYAHRYQSIFYTEAHNWIGVSAFIISTLVAFSYRFPSVDPEVFSNLPFFLKRNFFVPIASTLVAILTGLQTFLRPSEKSETHKKTASNYEKLRHRIELILTSSNASQDTTHRLDEIKEEWESLDSINVSNRFFSKGKKRVKAFEIYPDELDFLNEVKADS